MANNFFYIPLVNFPHRLSKEYDLGEGFSLVKFPREFDVDYRTFGHAYFKRHYGDRFLNEAKDTYCLRYHWPGRTFKSTQEMIYHIEDPAITFLIALRLIKPCTAGFKMMFHTPALSEEFPFDFSEYQMIGFRGGGSQVIQKFIEEEIEEAKTLFLKLLGLLKNEYHYRRIFNTLRYFDLGYRSPNVDSRVIFFMIALEVLYKPSQGKITRVIAQRLSGFLGKNREEKKILLERGYEMMNFKARLTHGDMTYFDISRPERIQIVVEEEEVLRRTLRKILRDDELIETFASLKKREVYFNTMLPQSFYSKSSHTQDKALKIKR